MPRIFVCAQRHKSLSPPVLQPLVVVFCCSFPSHNPRLANVCNIGCQALWLWRYWRFVLLKRRSQLQPRQVATGNQSLKFSEGAVDSSWAVEALVQNLEKTPFAWRSFGATFHPCYQALFEPIPTEMGIILVAEPKDGCFGRPRYGMIFVSGCKTFSNNILAGRRCDIG